VKISLNDWLRLGTIQPLEWGASLPDFFSLWPTEKAGFKQSIRLGCPFLDLGNIEFYFEDDNFHHLNELVIKVWCLSKKESSLYFDYDWLHADLTFPQVRAALYKLGIPHVVERGPAFNTPNIRTSSGCLFTFYPDLEQEDEDAILAKIYLAQPRQ
jgi:hypothetical protein